MKIIIHTILLCLIFCCSTNSQSPKENDLASINGIFFDMYKANRNSALDYLFSTNPFIDQSGIADVKDKFNSLVSQLGEYQGHELITTKSIGKNYVLSSYFVLYDRQPIRLMLTYYKVKNKWQLQNFHFDYEFDAELKEATNAYRLIENLPLEKN